jgi:predicted O-methyltransferase YrrM
MRHVFEDRAYLSSIFEGLQPISILDAGAHVGYTALQLAHRYPKVLYQIN